MRDWRDFTQKPEVREIGDLRAVLRDPGCNRHGPAYLMFRDIARTPEDRAWLSSHGLRFDVTCIPPADFCGEYAKTKGHYHPHNPSGTGYPEVYQVIAGVADFLLQSEDLKHVVLVRSGEGETVLVPPGYGHVTINWGEDELVMANIVASVFASDYRFYEEHRGAAYYELVTGELEKNPRYPPLPPIERTSARSRKPGPWFFGPLYERVTARDERLFSLVHPERFPELFSLS
ncbi:MAG: glucose-6-phosphate isomerase [Methanolinea sp.]|nr:glucose-6-phosphate isomerase [Methanolinea sp.]